MKVDVTEKSENIYFYNWMSLILVANTDFRLLIKIHCNETDVRKMANEALQVVDTSSKQAMIDFVKELTNLLGGAVKRSIEASSIQCGLSLPLLIKGFDELFSERTATADRAFYNLSTSGENFIIQIHFELLNDKASEILSQVKFSVGSESSGGFEFL